MGENNGEQPGTSSAGKWTVMVYMGSDDANAPLFVEQVKAMKDAGHHRDIEILVYFDPHEPGVNTSVLNINHKRKKKARTVQIGDDGNSFVRDVAEDVIDQSELPRGMQKVMNDAGKADQSLEAFLDYCLKTEADHYMLVLAGHGLIVANDAFMPDLNPRSGISLESLEKILRARFGPRQSNLEILAMHSCAMAGIEVVAQLKGTAKYMIASEGLAFVMGWQYRQVFKRFIKAIDRGDTVEELTESLYWLMYFSTRDFLLAGYPLELTLCNLDPRKVNKLTQEIGTLVQRLLEALTDDADEAAKDAIQLAHLKSQSYFGEAYTDLYDFCICLAEKCKAERLAPLRVACEDVITQLKPIFAEKHEVMKRFEAVVIQSNHFGWSTQYSRGLSVFFPWSEPVSQTQRKIMDVYREYAFNKDRDKSWAKFLTYYFEKTMRTSRADENVTRQTVNWFKPPIEDDDFVVSDVAGQLDVWQPVGGLEKPTGGSEKPTAGSDKPTGGSSDCGCPWIKNYPKNWWEQSKLEPPKPPKPPKSRKAAAGSRR